MFTYTTATLTIEDGNTQSTNFVDVDGYVIVGVSADAAFDGTGLTFDVSDDGATFIAGASGEAITVGDGEWASVDVSPARFVKVTSGAAQDGADSVITLYLRSN